MKIKFKYIGYDTEISANRENSFGRSVIHQPNKVILKFVSVDGAIAIDMTLDERNKLAVHLAETMRDETFEFDFGQPMPEKRLNTPLTKSK